MFYVIESMYGVCFATLTAQSGRKAPRFDRADPRVRGYAPPYTPAELLVRLLE